MLKRSLILSLFCAALGSAFGTSTDDGDPGPLGLPSIETLRIRLAMNQNQGRHCAAVYEKSKDKVREVERKDDEQKKVVRAEIVSKLKEFLVEDQQKKLDELLTENPK